MSDYAQMMVAQISSSNSKLTEYLQTPYREFKHTVAIEGVDDKSFYYDYLKDILDDDFYAFDCDGKKGVIDFKSSFLKYFANKPMPIAFFICDKDFDDILEKKIDGLTYTDLYSIESYLSEEYFIKYIFKKEHASIATKSKTDLFLAEFKRLLENSSESFADFAKIMIEIKSRDLDARFDETPISDFIEIKNQVTSKEIDIDLLLSKWRVEKEHHAGIKNNYKKWSEKLNKNEYKKWIRGKYIKQIYKKCFEYSFKKTFPQTKDLCLNYFGKDGIKIMKLCKSNLEFLKELKK